MKNLIYIEIKDGNPLGGSVELIAASAAMGAEAEALLIGSGLEEAAKAVASFGAAKVSVAEAEAPVSEDYIVDVICKAAQGDYALVLAAATMTGKAVMPRVAARLGVGYVADATAVAAAEGGFAVSRPAFGGTVIENETISGAKAVVTVKAGSFSKPEPVAAPVAVEAAAVAADPAALKAKIVEVIEETSKAVDIEAAKIVVGCGRGLANETDFHLAEELAEALGGVVGGSRPVIEAGLLPRQQQVGQSGKTITPDLYVAVAVSGATQHVAGMAGSKFVLAINKDEDAPIFNVADAGIVGDAKVILPLLIEAVKAHKAQ